MDVRLHGGANQERVSVPEIRGITVSVGEWYARTLERVLWKNMRHLSECLVVTAPGDPSADVARSVPWVRVLETSVFFEHGAHFNKGAAMEYGFSELGRHGWICIFDADILMPDHIPFDRLWPDAIHGARRRIVDDVDAWRPEMPWSSFRDIGDTSPIGYFQLFDADSPRIKGKSPWYDVTFGHAGGCDAHIMEYYPRDDWRMLPMDVLHFGPVDTHWFGANPDGLAMIEAYARRIGWDRRSNVRPDESAVAAVGTVAHRVSIPGYEPTGFEIPIAAGKRGAPGVDFGPDVETDATRTEPELPSMARQVTGFIKTAAAVVADGFGRTTPEQREKRLSICRSCDHFRESDMRCGQFNGCGCFLSRAVEWRAKECPIGRWAEHGV